MKTADDLEKIAIPRHKLYYLEQKGYINPKRIPMGDLEAREYLREDFLKVRLIWKYLKRGLKHKTAYQKAIEELKARGVVKWNERTEAEIDHLHPKAP
jgi:hypothetical protein